MRRFLGYLTYLLVLVSLWICIQPHLLWVSLTSCPTNINLSCDISTHILHISNTSSAPTSQPSATPTSSALHQHPLSTQTKGGVLLAPSLHLIDWHSLQTHLCSLLSSWLCQSDAATLYQDRSKAVFLSFYPSCLLQPRRNIGVLKSTKGDTQTFYFFSEYPKIHLFNM